MGILQQHAYFRFVQITSPSLNLFTQLNWLNVKERIEFSTVVLVFKCLNNLAPENLQSLFQPCGSLHNYPLRNVGIDLKVPKPRTETLRKSFGYMGSVIWNKLPSNDKKSESLRMFKHAMKQHLINVRTGLHATS